MFKSSSASIRSTRSSMLAFGSQDSTSARETPLAPRTAIPVATLHLPYSIPSTDNISPRLWCWIHGPDHRTPNVLDIGASGTSDVSENTHLPVLDRMRDQAALRRASGETRAIGVRGDGLPVSEHLRTLGFQQASQGGHQNEDQLAMMGMPKNVKMRKPLEMGAFQSNSSATLTLPKKKKAIIPTIQRIFIQIIDLKVKCSTKVSNVYCTIQVGSQKMWTGILPLTQESKRGLGLVVSPREGFIFDLLGNPTLDTNVSIHIFSGPPPPRHQIGSLQLQHYPPILPPRSVSPTPSTHTLKPLRFFSRLNIGLRTPHTPRTTIATAAESHHGVMSSNATSLGDTVVCVPGLVCDGDEASQVKKSVSCVVLGPNGKEVAVMTLQVGVLMDVPWPALPVIPDVEMADYLNFELASVSGGNIWKKYWTVIRAGTIEVYDFEYKERKPLISTLPLCQVLTRVSRPDPEIYYAHHCLELEFNPEIVGEDGGYDGYQWRKSVVQPDTGLVYVTADSKDGFLAWENAFKEFLI